MVLQDNLTKIIHATRLHTECPLLYTSSFDTPIGQILAIADDHVLYSLSFVDGQKKLELKAHVVPGATPPLVSIEQEMNAYFAGTLRTFNTPFLFLGSPFQKQVWEALRRIPYGVTKSYAEQAATIGNAKAYRAVANANGANPLVIMVPCHRIIRSSGEHGGYGGGSHRKTWLLEHELNNN